MNKEQIVGLAVRLFAVFLVVYTLRYAMSLVSFATLDPPDYVSSAFIVLIGLSPILIAIFLWRFPLAVASKLIPQTDASTKPGALDEVEFQVTAFSILGLWVLVSAIPDIFYWVTYVYRIKNIGFGQVRTELTPQNIASITSTIAEFILGVWLLLGSKGLVGMVRKLRHAGS